MKERVAYLFQGFDITQILIKHSDIILAILFVTIVAVLIIPMPTWILDALISTNITVAIFILITSLYISTALNISSFPTILLATTIFRLSLNVSTTRSILLNADAGHVIQTFGDFVVGGNYIVGGIVFIIITLVQFIVIAKGSERVAEVAARFTLDAMPGKQMSIDADLRSGILDVEGAKKKRRDLEKESQLYGAMDGAMKFVKGDSIAGIIITIVNIIGGIIIGTLQRDLKLVDALETYSLLTIGDGLVSQIPSILIALTAGIVVTRVSSEDKSHHLGRDIGEQFTDQPKTFLLSAIFVSIFGLIPGNPKAPIYLLSTFLFMIYGVLSRRKAEEAVVTAQEQQEVQQTMQAKGDIPLVIPSPIVLEVGDGITPIVDDKQDGGRFLNEMIPLLRHGLYYEIGVNFPGVQVRGQSRDLDPYQYIIKINEIPVANGSVVPGQLLVGEPLDQLRMFNIQGTETIHPVDGSTSTWVSDQYRDIIIQAGFRMWDAAEYLIIHLSAVLRKHAKEFLGIQEVQSILNQLSQSHPALVQEVVPKILTLGQVAEILQRLVQEDISVRDMKNIMHALAQWGPLEKDPLELTEYVRQSLSRFISNKYSGGSNTIVVYLLDPEIEQIVKNSVQKTDKGSYLALEPEITQDILDSVGREIKGHPPGGKPPVVLTNVEIRRYFRKLVELEYPRVAVLSYQELTPEMKIQPIARISLK